MATMARREWRALSAAEDWMLSRWRQAILEALQRGANPTFKSLAPALLAQLARSDHGGHARGARQLQRQLAAHGHSFRDLVAAKRKEHAIAQLRSTNRPLVDIAVEAGYAELSSFHRAVRRWTGLTPMRIRKTGTDREEAS
jgi:methylphosphotriester-DNA--protein-cysteine methyltransferase